jgi:PadR family transcriptional regulator PadR
MNKKSCGDSSENICNCGPYGRMLEPRLLLLLKNKKAYGYELIGELKRNDITNLRFDIGAVYRALREMEKNGAVRSTWAESAAGPSKRIYQITKKGRSNLKKWGEIIRQRKKSLEKFLRLYKKG